MSEQALTPIADPAPSEERFDERLKDTHRLPPLTILPAMGWFLWFLLIPLSIVAIYSFSTKGPYGGVVFQWTSENFVRATDWLYLRVFFNSLKLALITAVLCFLVGFPMAYVMATAPRAWRSVLLMAVVVPFWTTFVVRAYAIKVLLGDQGPLNQLLLALGWIHQPLPLSNSTFSVLFGMVSNYLPFMVLPLYVSLEKFDFTLLEAARDLGARSWSVLWRVLLPLNRAGIITGCVFVFTPALGEFVIPDLLGGARTLLIGNLVTEQFLKTRDWPFGAALSLLLIATVLVSLVVQLRAEYRERERALLSGERR